MLYIKQYDQAGAAKAFHNFLKASLQGNRVASIYVDKATPFSRSKPAALNDRSIQQLLALPVEKLAEALSGCKRVFIHARNDKETWKVTYDLAKHKLLFAGLAN